MKVTSRSILVYVCLNLITGLSLAEEVEVEPPVLSADILVNESVAEIINSPDALLNTSDHVLLVPGGEINSSFSKKVDPAVVQQLRNAINATQLHYKNEDAFVPVSTAQTIDRIQSYMAQAVHGHLSGCGVANKVQEEDAPDNIQVPVRPLNDYLYRIDLGVNRLVINRSLLSAKLIGEAEAKISENNRESKQIAVNSYSFADKEMLLELYQSEGLEKDLELKNVTSRMVDRLAERLGKKLCQYFN